MSSNSYSITLRVLHDTPPRPRNGGNLSDPVLVSDDEDEQHTNGEPEDHRFVLHGGNASDPMLISDEEDEQDTHQGSDSPQPAPLPVGNGTSATTGSRTINISIAPAAPGGTNWRDQGLDPIRDSIVSDGPAQASAHIQAQVTNTVLTPPQLAREPRCIFNMHSDAACIHRAYAHSRETLLAVHEAIDRRKPHPFCISGIPITHSDDTLVQNIHVLKMRVERGRVYTFMSTPRCPRHTVTRRWPLVKIVAAQTINSVRKCMKRICPYHASHTCGNGDFCIDFHCNIERGTDNYGREDCFKEAVEDCNSGIPIPEFCSDPRHAHTKCRLWLHVEGATCPQSMLIKEKAMFLGKQPEELTEADIGHLFLVDVDGTPDPTSQLAAEDFSYMVWDYTRNNRQLPQVRRLRLSDAQMSNGPSREVSKGNGPGFFNKIKNFAGLAHLGV